MKRILLLILFLTSILQSGWADNTALLDSLDNCLAYKPTAETEKKDQINYLKEKLIEENNPELKLKICMDIYKASYVFNFNLANFYVNKGLCLAQATHNVYYEQLFLIHKAELLAISGFYHESIKTIKLVNLTTLSRNIKFNYFYTLSRIYGYWADYCNDKEYCPKYRKLRNDYLQLSMSYLPHDITHDYYMGEYCTYVKHDPMQARFYYLRVLKKNPEYSRFYAMSCFALSGNYKDGGDSGKFEEYLIRASISDSKSVTMENFALQNLAIYLFQQDRKNLNRAQRYIIQSLNDAKFYNDRLRILEISQNLPIIIQQYQYVINNRNHVQIIAIITISLLFILLLIFLIIFLRQNKRLNYSRIILKKTNRQLVVLNKKQETLNGQLHNANLKLVDTNRKRENLAKLFIDLCDKYITRLGKYQLFVKRKIKTNQTGELLTYLSSTKLSEEDSEIFYTKFDNAFLYLYPNFINEFNQLLQKDQQIQVREKSSLNPELRIYALIRLGVKESREISNLLFYSPQTVYNYRSCTKNKAIDKDNFEDNVRKLCTMISKN